MSALDDYLKTLPAAAPDPQAIRESARQELQNLVDRAFDAVRIVEDLVGEAQAELRDTLKEYFREQRAEIEKRIDQQVAVMEELGGRAVTHGQSLRQIADKVAEVAARKIPEIPPDLARKAQVEAAKRDVEQVIAKVRGTVESLGGQVVDVDGRVTQLRREIDAELETIRKSVSKVGKAGAVGGFGGMSALAVYDDDGLVARRQAIEFPGVDVADDPANSRVVVDLNGTFAPLTALAEAYVDPTGTLTGAPFYSTLAAAVSAISAGGRIYVLGNLTFTAAQAITKTCTIDFLGHSVVNAAASSGVDVFTSGVAIGSTGVVSGVRIINLGGITRSGTGRGGKAVNFHGAMQWVVHPSGAGSTISDHDVAGYFDASPGSTGYCFHNALGAAGRRWRVATCGIAVQNLSSANDNEAHVYAYNCDQTVSATSGLSLRLPNLAIEVLDAGISGATPQIAISMNHVSIPGLHAECQSGAPIIALSGSARGTFIQGTAYNDVSGSVITIGTSVDDYEIILPQATYRSDHGRHCRALADVTATATRTLMRATYSPTRIREVSIIPEGFVSYTAGTDLWTVQLEEWNGNAKVQNLATLFTQSAQIGLTAGITISGLPVTLAAGRILRATFTKTGAPASWTTPMVTIRYDSVPS